MNICNSIIHNGPSLEATKMSFIMNRWETMVHSDTGVYLVLKRKELSKKKKKERNYQNMKRHRGDLRAYYSVKEASLKSVLTVWFPVCDFLEW